MTKHLSYKLERKKGLYWLITLRLSFWVFPSKEGALNIGKSSKIPGLHFVFFQTMWFVHKDRKITILNKH